jgi:histidine triad (HIT) family protein
MTDPCVFCEIVAGRGPADVFWVWPDALAIVPRNPVTEEHVLVIPNVHVEDFREDPVISALTMARAAELAAHMDQPTNLITSAGEAATQTVKHLHLHLVPRRVGDGLALPRTGQQVSVQHDPSPVLQPVPQGVVQPLPEPRCRSKIAHESGMVLQCMRRPGHPASHRAGTVRWDDGHPDELIESTVSADPKPSLPELLGQLGDHLTEQEKSDLLAGLECHDRPAITLTRHRYVLGKISAKCDYESAVDAFRHYGGRIERSTVVAYELGDEHLGTWEQVWPPVAPTRPAEPGALCGEPAVVGYSLPPFRTLRAEFRAWRRDQATPASAGEPKATPKDLQTSTEEDR